MPSLLLIPGQSNYSDRFLGHLHQFCPHRWFKHITCTFITSKIQQRNDSTVFYSKVMHSNFRYTGTYHNDILVTDVRKLLQNTNELLTTYDINRNIYKRASSYVYSVIKCLHFICFTKRYHNLSEQTLILPVGSFHIHLW